MDENFNRHRNPCNFDDWRQRRNGAKRAAGFDEKVDGTDNVYVFRYGGHQSMFIVTSQGVIATDPISYLRPATTFKADGMEYSRPGYLSRPVCGSRGSSH